MDYLNDIQIDESALDVEWLEQATLTYKYGIALNEISSAVRDQEDIIKLIISDLTLDLHENPEAYVGKGKKVTVAYVENYILQDVEHIKAVKKLRKLLKEEADLKVAKDAIANTKKAALENLVRLHAANYFASPSEPRDLTEEVSISREQKGSNQKIKVRK